MERDAVILEVGLNEAATRAQNRHVPAAHPEQTNARLVEQAVRWAKESGRPMATPGDVRRRFGLPQRRVADG